MPDFSQRHPGPELLDLPNIPSPDLFQNLKELALINRWLGGHQAVGYGFKRLWKPGTEVVELGSGGGDNLRFLQRQFPQNWQGIGVDLKSDCTEFAQKQASGNLQFQTLDYRHFTPKTHPTLFFTSLFCHHFTEEELIDMLKWLHKNGSGGFFIADLHRHPLAYYSIRLLTQLFSSSYLVKHDAPLSVLRGFRKADWIHLLKSAGIDQYEIKWIWAFRWVIVVPPQ